MPGTPDEAAAQAVEEAMDAAQTTPPPPPTSFVTNGQDEPPVDEEIEDIEEYEEEGPNYLLWGAIGVVVLGGLGFLAWRFGRRPRMKANAAVVRSGDARSIPGSAPPDVKKVIRDVVASSKKYRGDGMFAVHPGAPDHDPSKIVWEYNDDGSWEISDGAGRRRAWFIRDFEGNWVLESTGGKDPVYAGRLETLPLRTAEELELWAHNYFNRPAEY
jgi:hypothetical protein